MTTPSRSAQDVFAEHLHEGKYGSVEDDLERNYAADVVVLSGRGIHRGHVGVRELARLMREELPEAQFAYQTKLLEGEMAFLEWTGRSEEATVEDGADSFLIREGQIVAQTIHDTVRPRSAPERKGS